MAIQSTPMKSVCYRRIRFRSTGFWVWVCCLLLLPKTGFADNLGATTLRSQVALEQHSGGTFYLPVTVNGVSGQFLLDTGAGMVTVSEALFSTIKKSTNVRHVKTMAARLANNRTQKIEIFEVDSLAVGGCELGSVEIAVMRGGGRNLLGLSALNIAAPFTINTAPPNLELSGCIS